MVFRRHHHLSLPSTQDACRALAEQGAPEGTLVTADEQTAGRGRTGHTWFSPRGQAIYASILLRPALPLRQTAWLTMLAALAAREAIDFVGAGLRPAPAPATIKWLNDIHLVSKKVCGILVETAIVEDQLEYAIVGIGLNVNTDFAHAPEDVRARATGLQQAFGIEFDGEAVLRVLLSQFDARYAHLQRTPLSPAAEYAQHVETLGQAVRVQMGDEVVEGVAVGVNDEGALQVETRQGLQTASFGHVL